MPSQTVNYRNLAGSPPNNSPPVAEAPPSERHGPSPWRQAAHDWKWEMVATLFAMTILGAMAALLSTSDGMEELNTGIVNLNTEVAVLSTVLRALLVYVLAQVIGQYKWWWFDTPRPLRDLERFHEASSSVFAYLGLMVARRKIDLVMLCGLLMIATFGTGPFTQQAIRNMPCPRPLPSQAAIPVSHFIDARTNGRCSEQAAVLDLTTRGVMLQSFASTNGDITRVSATCATGNCTFPTRVNNVTHSSIGMCSKCVDVSELVTMSTPTGLSLPIRASLPNGLIVGGLALNAANKGALAWTNMSTLTQAPITQSVEYPLAWARPVLDKSPGFESLINSSYTTSTVLYLSNSSTSSDLVAGGAICTLSPCIQQYSGRVSDGVFTETPVSETQMQLYFDRNDEAMAWGMLSPCEVNGRIYTKDDITTFSSSETSDLLTMPVDPLSYGDTATVPDLVVNLSNMTVPRECIYAIGGCYGTSMELFLSDALVGSCTGFGDGSSASISCERTTGSTTLFWLEGLVANYNATFDSVGNSFGNLAAAATSRLRVVGQGSGALDFGTFSDSTSLPGFDGEQVLGDATRMTVCYMIQWAWLTYPLGFVVANFCLTLIMLVETVKRREAGQPIWKSSLLPLLFHRLFETGSGGQPATYNPGPGVSFRGAHDEIHSMERRANAIVVSLGERGGHSNQHSTGSFGIDGRSSTQDQKAMEMQSRDYRV